MDRGNVRKGRKDLGRKGKKKRGGKVGSGVLVRKKKGGRKEGKDWR